jgi:hypothetical protein
MSVFSEILDSQIKHKFSYVNKLSTLYGGISIVLSNNTIKEVIDGEGWVHPRRKAQYIQLIQACLDMFELKDAILNINLLDKPVSGYLNFCRIKGNNEQFLLPNHRFINDDITGYKTYEEIKSFLKENDKPFNEKVKKIYTSCILHRDKQAYFKYALEHTFCSGYVWLDSNYKSLEIPPSLITQLRIKQMAGDKQVPFIDHAKYKYLLYNDGNSLSDRMRLLLCLNSVIIKGSTKYEEFYSYKLKPNENFLEYKFPGELNDIFMKLEQNPSISHKIISNNKEFIENTLTHINILKYTRDLINLTCV